MVDVTGIILAVAYLGFMLFLIFRKKGKNPDNVELVRPGLWIKTTKREKYRQVYPIWWEGKLILRHMIWPPNFTPFALFILLFIFMAWQSAEQMDQYNEFIEPIFESPVGWCSEVISGYQIPGCTDFLREAGLCTFNDSAKQQNIKIWGRDS
jgi:hypothetical protein